MPDMTPENLSEVSKSSNPWSVGMLFEPKGEEGSSRK